MVFNCTRVVTVTLGPDTRFRPPLAQDHVDASNSYGSEWGSGLSQSSSTFPLLRASYRSRLARRIQVVSISILTPSRLYRYTHAPPPTPALVGECVSGREDAGVPGCIRNNSQLSF